MKLRVKHNSIRLRLTQPEVERLVSERVVEERIEFDADRRNTLVYAVRLEESSLDVSAAFRSGAITVTLPENQARLWAASHSEVGIYFDQNLGNGATLGILIEKDFRCAHAPAGEIEPGAYPNPALATPS